MFLVIKLNNLNQGNAKVAHEFKHQIIITKAKSIMKITRLINVQNVIMVGSQWQINLIVCNQLPIVLMMNIEECFQIMTMMTM